MAQARSAGTTIAVLPFENLDPVRHGAQTGPAQGTDYFSRGFTEDVIADLARFPELDVIAPQSAERLTHPDPGAPTADYALSGSLRRSVDKLRLSVSLTTPDGKVAWADRFDRPLQDLFEVQDAITSQVVASISSRVQRNLLSAARRKPIPELAAYDCWLRGHDLLREGSLAADEQARTFFMAALERDPHYGRAYLGLSLSYFNEWSCQLWDRWDANEQLAYQHALKASELDPDDHYARVVLGRVLLFRREFGLAEPQLRRALSLNRNDADALVVIAMNLGYLGDTDAAMEAYERAQRLNPDHDPWYFAYGIVPCFSRGDWKGVLDCATATPIETMVDVAAYRAVAYGHLGDHGRARECVDQYLHQFRAKIAGERELEPGEALRWALHVNPYRRPEDSERLRDGLVRAGLEEGAESRTSRALTPPSDRSALRRVGSVWQASFAGRDAHLPNLKGLQDIATLLAHAGDEVHCETLMGGVGSLGEEEDVIDTQARDAYRARIRELGEELAAAEADHDLGRAERLRAELDALTEHLDRAYGLGGRGRKLKSGSERARSAVTWRIRSALKKLEESHEPLARHFSQAIQTGTYCSYSPPTPVSWTL